MKLNRILTLCAITAALALSVGDAFAQAQDNGGNNNNNGGQGGGQGGQGGQRRNRQGGGPGGGNFDPAQIQQRMVDGARDRLEFTNDTEWAAVEPLVTKVVAARMDVGMGGMGRMFRPRNNNNGGGNNPGRGGFGGQTSPEQEALQNALDSNAPSAQIKDLLTKYKSSQKAKQAKLEAAQADLKKVLTTKQEAEAYLLQLVN
jgi:hypothetical protein